jgi:signal transduction histidine kinase
MSYSIEKKITNLNLRTIILLFAGIIITLISCLYFLGFIISPNTGLISGFPEITLNNSELVFSPKDPISKPIVSALIPYVDIITQIDDKPIKSVHDLTTSLFDKKDFTPIRITVKRKDVGLVQLSAEPQPNILRIDWIFTLVMAIVCAFVGFFLILRFSNSFDYQAGAFAAFLFMLYGCVKPYYFQNMESYVLVQLSSFSPWLIALFSLYFPFKKGNQTIRLSLIVFFATLLVIFTIIKIVIFQLWISTGSDLLYSIINQTELITQIGQTAALLLFLALCIYSYSKSHYHYEKRQIEWILAGMIISFTPFFFFDRLPFIAGKFMGESMSIGSFTNIFLAMFPVFFLMGIATNKKLNIRVTLNRLLVSVFVILLLSLLYLLIIEPATNYLLEHYGFTLIRGTYVVTFIIALALFVSVFTIDKLFEKLGNKNAAQSYRLIENQYQKLLIEHEKMTTHQSLRLQSEKLSDLHAFFFGIKDRMQAESAKLKKAIIVFEKLLKKQFARISSQSNIEDVKNERNEAEKELNASKEALIRIADCYSNIESILRVKPAVRGWTGAEYIVKSAISEVSKKYPDAEIEIEMDHDYKVFCVQHEIISVLREIIFNAIESQAAICCKVSIHVMHSDKATCFEIIDAGEGIENSRKKKLCEPFYSNKPGHEGLGLYLSKTLTEKNEGSLVFANGYTEGTIVTVSFLNESNDKK